MNVEREQLISLLRQVDRTRLEYELAARLTGENFNVFDILRLGASEVRTHSAFIAELLDPKGAHGQGDVYLKLFLKMEKVKPCIGDFGYGHVNVQVEYPIGPIDSEKTEGGRIDILLTDSRGNHIIIENKIYAVDQENQLIRYYNFDRLAPLFYLSLDGKDPDKKPPDDVEYHTLSYCKDMRCWLEDCHKASVSLPVVRETIFQYENLIKKLTNQACGDKMKEKIIAIITEHPELADAVSAMGGAWEEIRTVTYQKFKDLMCIRFPNCILKLEDGACVERLWDDQEIGIFIGFRTTKGERGLYATKLQEIDSSARPSLHWDVGQFNPAPFTPLNPRFENLPKADIISLYKSEEALSEFVARLVKQAEDVTEKLFPGAERLSIESIQQP